MDQPITGFHKDREGHWVAELVCGHGQHVRHDPPWMIREWVISEEGRASRLNTNLNCVRCDEMGNAVASQVRTELKKRVLQEYENAGLSGLCDEGRLEVALGAVDTFDLQPAIEAALKQKP